MYRESFSFAGLSYDSEKSIIAKSFVKSTLELVLPPVRYRNFGFFNLFATHSHATIFAGGLFINNNETTTDVNQVSNIKYSESFRNIGFQVDTKLVMFSHLSSTFSFGWARAFEVGNDIILMSTNVSQGVKLISESYKKGKISESRLSSSVKKILSLKARSNLKNFKTCLQIITHSSILFC